MPPNGRSVGANTSPHWASTSRDEVPSPPTQTGAQDVRGKTSVASSIASPKSAPGASPRNRGGRRPQATPKTPARLAARRWNVRAPVAGEVLCGTLKRRRHGRWRGFADVSAASAGRALPWPPKGSPPGVGATFRGRLNPTARSGLKGAWSGRPQRRATGSSRWLIGRGRGGATSVVRTWARTLSEPQEMT